jgi:hypothetical protein
MRSAVLFAAVALALATSAEAEHLPWQHRAAPAPRPRAGAALPVFQAIGEFGDIAVIDTGHLLSVATFLAPDAPFSEIAGETGLATSASGTTYVVGNNGRDSVLARLDLGTGAATSIGTITGEVVVDLAFDGSGTLYALTDNTEGAHPHALLAVDTATAAATVMTTLDSHGGTYDFGEFGAIAWNPADSFLYHADLAADGTVFVDKVAPGTWSETAVLSGSTVTAYPSAMAFLGGRLYLFTNGPDYSVDATSIGADFEDEGFVFFPSADGQFAYAPQGVAPPSLACTPSETAACLYGRFKVEVAYDATPASGSGPASVVLESGASVKFTFFDPSNIEMILKVLNACSPPFNHWWVFAGGLTNVGVSITVTDTSTGAKKTYSSTKGTLFQPFADTAAFDCP